MSGSRRMHRAPRTQSYAHGVHNDKAQAVRLAAHLAIPRRSASSSPFVQRWLGRSRTTVVPDGGMLRPLRGNKGQQAVRS